MIGDRRYVADAVVVEVAVDGAAFGDVLWKERARPASSRARCRRPIVVLQHPSRIREETKCHELLLPPCLEPRG